MFLMGMIWMVAFAARSHGDDIYVSNTIGRDEYNGQFPRFSGGGNGPYQTIQLAVRRANPGDRIVILPSDQPYREEVIIHGGRVHGWERFPIVIEGNGVEWTGERPIERDEWVYLDNGIYQTAGLTQVLGILALAGGNLERLNHPMWGERPTLEPRQYALWQGSFLLRVGERERIDSYKCTVSHLDCGLLICQAPNLILRNLRMRGFRLDAVQVRGPVQSVRFENCLFGNNGRAGVAVVTAGRVDLSNCFLENNARTAAVVGNHSSLTLASCALTGSPQDSSCDATSRLTRSGGAPHPLQKGPFVIPEGFLREPPRRGEPKPVEPAENKPAKTSFFEN